MPVLVAAIANFINIKKKAAEHLCTVFVTETPL